MNILLLSPGKNLKGIGTLKTPPLGLGYIAGILRRDTNFNVKIIDLSIENINIEKEAKWSDVLGVSINALLVNSALKIISKFKEINENIIVVIGGPYPTAVPEIARTKIIDYVILGEGEYPFKDLVISLNRGEKPHNVPGIYFYEEGNLISNPPKTIYNLDSLPFPAYDLLNINKYNIRGCRKPFMTIITSRGCPFNCIYCTHCVHGYEFRFRTPENVLQEILYLKDKFRIKEIAIMDDNFAVNKKRAIEICDLIIKENLNLRFSLLNGIRIETLDKNLLKKLKEAGVYKIAFGLESGSKRIQKNINKNLNLKLAEKVVKMTKDLDIITVGYFMLGLPGDDRKSMQDTINFAKRINPDYAFFHITIPFPGTPLYEMIRKDGKFLYDTKFGINEGYSSGKVFYLIGKMNKKILEVFFKKSHREFYLRPKKLVERISSIKSFNELKELSHAVLEYIT
jgi:radical SAM superfamily enzyme YgiQ (UPF0313 family)